MRLSRRDKATINKMIKTETIYGLPLAEITPDIFDALEEEEIRTLYIVTSMLQWDCFDAMSNAHFPEEASQYLTRFTLKSN